MTASAVTAPARRFGLIPTMSASRPARRNTRGPPPPMRIGRWLCVGFGDRLVVGHRVVLAREREGSGAEAAPDHRERLLESLDPHSGPVVREAERGVVGLHPSRADAELGAPAREHVDRRDLLGEDRGVLVVVVEHERADAQRGRRGRGRRHPDHRRELGVDEVVGEVDGGVAELLRPSGQRHERPGVEAPADLHTEPERLGHGNPISETTRCSARQVPVGRSTTGTKTSTNSSGTTTWLLDGPAPGYFPVDPKPNVSRVVSSSASTTCHST